MTLFVHGQAGLEMTQTTTDNLYKQNIHALSAIFIKQARSVYTGASFLQFLFSRGMMLMVVDLANEIGASEIRRMLLGSLG